MMCFFKTMSIVKNLEQNDYYILKLFDEIVQCSGNGSRYPMCTLIKQVMMTQICQMNIYVQN